MMMMLLLFVIRLLSLLPLSLSLSLLHVLFPLSRFLGSIAALLSHTLQQNRRNNPIGSYANFKVLVSGNQIALTVINLQCILMHCHLPHPYPYPLPSLLPQHAHTTISTCSTRWQFRLKRKGVALVIYHTYLSYTIYI